MSGWSTTIATQLATIFQITGMVIHIWQSGPGACACVFALFCSLWDNGPAFYFR